jgi:hypothetical protein
MISFSTAQAEKNWWKKLENTRFVVWWLDPMSSLYVKNQSTHSDFFFLLKILD